MARSLRRFFISKALEKNSGDASGATILLTQGETHHAKNVLRMKEGDLCFLFDRSGCEYLSRFEHFHRNGCCEAKLLELSKKDRVSQFQLSVAQAIPQHRKMDFIVEKAAELGVFEIIPLETERTIVRVAKERESKVHHRWNRILEEALGQSKATIFPEIAPVTSLSKLCEQFDRFDQVFIFHPSQNVENIQSAFSQVKTLLMGISHPLLKILFLIGPEGGFSEKEIDQVKACGAKAVSFASSILKTDTAFISAVSIAQFLWGE